MEQRKHLYLFGVRETIRERHDDGENHRRGADDGSANEHGFLPCFKGVARAVVRFEELLAR